MPWDDDHELHRMQHLADDGAEGFGQGQLQHARARVAGGMGGMPQGMPMMPGAPGLGGPVPGASWGPVHGGHNGPLIMGGYPDAMRRGDDGMGMGMGGPGRPTSNPSDYFFSVDEALSGSPHARTCAPRAAETRPCVRHEIFFRLVSSPRAGPALVGSGLRRSQRRAPGAVLPCAPRTRAPVSAGVRWARRQALGCPSVLAAGGHTHRFSRRLTRAICPGTGPAGR